MHSSGEGSERTVAEWPVILGATRGRIDPTFSQHSSAIYNECPSLAVLEVQGGLPGQYSTTLFFVDEDTMARSRSKSRERRRRSRSRSGERKVRERSRERDRDRDDRVGLKRRYSSRERRSRSRSPYERRRSRSRERRGRDRDDVRRGKDSRSPHDRRRRDDKDRLPPQEPISLEQITNCEQDVAMLMGFCGFNTTKNKKVHGNYDGAVKINKPRRYRQYMNRKGGFNRPLDYIA
ncbi:hypothetical protein KIN20_036256 [Parelaphostrongylus tenuis]|uniref:U4/U6.U5 small nuclear ribonucleoprotein 27 kDa protein n=1 Tax=Parelaphostrongylus tenuis TaxID=148309 RepID=A0AAD5RCC7_PARTN|nr:hypothetical protein KIN20_036256 [Parelaphostrongylus tenuis]